MTRPYRNHWYRIFIEECPVCGRGRTWRERVYGKKPKSLKRRINYVSQYDQCVY